MTELLYVAHIGLWIAVVLQGFAICVLVYRNSQLLKVAAAGSAIGGHATGADAPAFEAKNLRTGEIVSHRQMGGQMGGQRTFLLFVTPSCSDCRKLMAELASLMEKLATATDGNNTFTGLVIYCDGANRGCLNAYPTTWARCRFSWSTMSMFINCSAFALCRRWWNWITLGTSLRTRIHRARRTSGASCLSAHLSTKNSATKNSEHCACIR